MKFSITTQSFYAEGLQFGASLPGDAIEIEQSAADELFQAINDGSHVYSESGVLKASAPRPDQYHTWDSSINSWVITDSSAVQQKQDEIASAEQRRQQLIDSAMQSVSIIQLKLQAGRTLTDAEAKKLNTVLDYIDAVNEVDTSAAPGISWPITLPE
ncbi:TPA: tail fiber assembly protein [Klebsiella aerogenes]|nr:tail fiber assembly protein [Klebsiella aerogenes]